MSLISRISAAMAVLSAVVAGSMYLSNTSLRDTIAAHEAEIASQARSIATLTDAAEQAREARRLEAIRAAQAEARAKELQGQIETILTGDFDDAPLDPRLADFLNGLPGGKDH